LPQQSQSPEAEPSQGQRPARRALRRLRLEHLAVGLLLALLITWPLALHFTTHLPGDERIGAYSHAWKLWWTAQAVLTDHSNPAWCWRVHYPAGLPVGFFTTNFFNGVLATPATVAWGAVAGFNLVALSTIAAGCWAASLLARRLGLGFWTATLAGVAWAGSPNALGALWGGAVELMPGPWPPLLLLCLVCLLDEERARGWAVRGAAALGVAGCVLAASLTSWRAGFPLALLGAWLLVAWRVTTGPTPWRANAFALGGLALGALATALAASWLLPMPPQQGVSMPFTTVPLGMVWDPPYWAIRADLTEHIPAGGITHHVLFSVGALCVLSLRSRLGRLYLLVAAPLLLDLILPAWVLFDLSQAGHGPGLLSDVLYFIARHDGRRMVLLHLPLALAAAWGMRELVALATRRLPLCAGLVAAGVIALWAVELTVLSPGPIPSPTFPARSPDYARHLASAPKGAVIDVPLMYSYAEMPGPYSKFVASTYVFDQTLHGRPSLASVGTDQSHSVADMPVRNVLLEALVSDGSTRLQSLQRLPPGSSDPLAERGFRWLVLHADHLPQAEFAGLTLALERLLGPPERFSDGDVVFELPAPSEGYGETAPPEGWPANAGSASWPVDTFMPPEPDSTAHRRHR
jgi:hypothetical protein